MHYPLQIAISDQRKRMAEVESTAISHRAEAASLYRQAESAKQEAASVRQELARSRDSQRATEAELRGEVIGLRAEADATIEALRMQLTAVTSKLKRLVAELSWHTATYHNWDFAGRLSWHVRCCPCVSGCLSVPAKWHLTACQEARRQTVILPTSTTFDADGHPLSHATSIPSVCCLADRACLHQ